MMVFNRNCHRHYNTLTEPYDVLENNRHEPQHGTSYSRKHMRKPSLLHVQFLKLRSVQEPTNTWSTKNQPTDNFALLAHTHSWLLKPPASHTWAHVRLNIWALDRQRGRISWLLKKDPLVFVYGTSFRATSAACVKFMAVPDGHTYSLSDTGIEDTTQRLETNLKVGIKILSILEPDLMGDRKNRYSTFIEYLYSAWLPSCFLSAYVCLPRSKQMMSTCPGKTLSWYGVKVWKVKRARWFSITKDKNSKIRYRVSNCTYQVMAKQIPIQRFLSRYIALKTFSQPAHLFCFLVCIWNPRREACNLIILITEFNTLQLLLLPFLILF